MPYSKIVITFNTWSSGDPTGTVITFAVNGSPKTETAVPIRTTSYQFTVAGDNASAAMSYRNAWQVDYGYGFTTGIVGNVVTIQATFDGAVFSGFSAGGRCTAVITNETPPPPAFTLTGYVIQPADTNKCSFVKVTLNQLNGTPPFVWETTPWAGTVGLVADISRYGTFVSIRVQDSLGAESTILVPTPVPLVTAVVGVTIEGDVSGLFGTVMVNVTGYSTTGTLPTIFEYSLDNVTWQSSNVFPSVFEGLYTVYVKDQFDCVLTYDFEVSLETIRPPVYRAIPRSNSFGWYEIQALVSNCVNPYNGTNAIPNNYKPTRFYNPKYFQPWCSVDNPPTQFRSNYDTLLAELINVITGEVVVTPTIEQKSNNIGKRQIMDARIYDRGSGQTGVYWIAGNIYDNDGTTVIGTYELNGQLPEWVRVGQKFTLTGSASDGVYEIKQVIFDSILLVNAAVLDRVYTDITDPLYVKVDATYNKLNYETFEFYTELGEIDEGCYKVKLSMTDSLNEYADSIWETFPFIVSINGSPDHVYIESSDHIDDGIDYSTGIIHKQRFAGLFYEEEYPSTYETSRDSRKQLKKLDGRVQKTFSLLADNVPYWVYEKLALFIAKNNIRVNNLQVQFEEGFEVERAKTYSRVNLTAEAFVSGYEQYLTNAYDNL